MRLRWWWLVVGAGCATAPERSPLEGPSWHTVERAEYRLSAPGTWRTFAEARPIGGASVSTWGGEADAGGVRYGLVCLDFPAPLAEQMDRDELAQEQLLVHRGVPPEG